MAKKTKKNESFTAFEPQSQAFIDFKWLLIPLFLIIGSSILWYITKGGLVWDDLILFNHPAYARHGASFDNVFASSPPWALNTWHPLSMAWELFLTKLTVSHSTIKFIGAFPYLLAISIFAKITFDKTMTEKPSWFLGGSVLLVSILVLTWPSGNEVLFWFSATDTGLAILFALSGLFFYMRKSEGNAAQGILVICGMLSVLSKEVGIFSIALIMSLVISLSPHDANISKKKLIFLVVSPLLFGALWLFLKVAFTGNSVALGQNVQLGSLPLEGMKDFLETLSLLFIPIMAPHPVRTINQIASFTSLLGLLILCLWIWKIFIESKKNGLKGALFPITSLVVLFTITFIGRLSAPEGEAGALSKNIAYLLPFVALYLFVDIFKKISLIEKDLIPFASLAVFAAVYSTSAIMETRFSVSWWTSDSSFWDRAVLESDSPIATVNAALSMARRDRGSEAVALLATAAEKVIKKNANPTLPELVMLSNAASALTEMNDIERAREILLWGLPYSARVPQIAHNLFLLEFNEGRTERALEATVKALGYMKNSGTTSSWRTVLILDTAKALFKEERREEANQMLAIAEREGGKLGAAAALAIRAKDDEKWLPKAPEKEPDFCPITPAPVKK